MAVASGMAELLSGNGPGVSQLRRAVLDGFDDVDVAGAAAQVARDAAADLGFCRARIACKERFRRHQHAWRAETALEAVLLQKAFLQRVELGILLQAFHRLD